MMRNKFILKVVSEAGDVVLLAFGGHGFEMLEPTEIIEVKQGPYAGEHDKTRLQVLTLIKEVVMSIPFQLTINTTTSFISRKILHQRLNTLTRFSSIIDPVKIFLNLPEPDVMEACFRAWIQSSWN